MDMHEVQIIKDTLHKEDDTNLKILQKLVSKEINDRMMYIKTMHPLDYNSEQAAIPVKPATKEKTMNAYSQATVFTSPTVSIEEKRIAMLQNQLSEAYYRKEKELKQEHGLIDDDTPRTPKELVERIEKGHYVLPEREKDFYYGDLTCAISWRNPKTKKDQEGFDAAEKKMQEKERTAFRLIALKSPDEGLKALEDFEKSKFH